MADIDTHLLNHIRQGRETEALEVLQHTLYPDRLVDGAGKTVLHHAAENGCDRVAEYLVKCAADINAKDREGKTPLMLAAEHSHTIDFLLNSNADIHARDNDGKCAFQLFSEEVRYKILEKLNAECAGDTEKIAAKLVDWKCSVYSSLVLKNTELTRLLLTRGCPVDSPDGVLPRTTALMRAALRNDVENVRILLDHGVDVNAESHRGVTALGAYGLSNDPRNQNPEILRMILDRGVDPLVVISNGTRQEGQMQISRILKYRDRAAIRILLERDFDLYAKDAHGCTVLHYMAGNKLAGVMEELKGKKYDVNSRDNSGRTPLHCVEPTNLSNVHFLVDEGADVDAKDVHGLTPLMAMWQRIGAYDRARMLDDRYRVKKGNAKRGIESLLFHGADPQASTPITREYPVFSIVDGDYGFYWMQPVLAHLELMEARGTFVECIVRNKISENKLLREYFEMCTQQIEEMKNIKIWKLISLHKLLIGSRVKIEGYVCNDQLLVNLRRMKCQNKYIPYYVYVLRNSVAKAVKIVRLRKEVAAILCEMVGLCPNSHSTVIDKITSYLSERDLRKLHYVI